MASRVVELGAVRVRCVLGAPAVLADRAHSDPLALSELADPELIGTGLPTWVPPETQPPEVTWDGLQRKKVIVPVGAGWPPAAEMVATSNWFASPSGTVEPPGVAVVWMGGVTQVSSVPPA